MKYKAKFNADQKHFHTSFTMRVDEEQIFTDVEGLTPGAFVFIPFTDTRFFEPVKVRKFEVEVNEDDMDRFMFYNRNEPWVHKEIIENKYISGLKANKEIHPDVVHIVSCNLDSIVNAYNCAIEECDSGAKLEVIKWMKYWLNECYPSIAGLKEAKDIVDSWWGLIK